VHVYKESHLEATYMSQSGNQWLNRVDEDLVESTQYASGERVLTPKAEQLNMTRTTADARCDLIECENELQDLRKSSFDDLESLQKKHKITRKCTVWLDRARIQFRFLRPSSFNTALQLVLRPHFLVHFV
jgi:hypothetical protein